MKNVLFGLLAALVLCVLLLGSIQTQRAIIDERDPNPGPGAAHSDLLTPAAHTPPLPPRTISLEQVIDALVEVESGGDPCAVGDDGKALGLLQIWEITVDDVNRILGYEAYTYADRCSPAKSRAMCRIILLHYCAGGTAEDMARRWVGGTKYQDTAGADEYWLKVEAALCL
jgi:hypothetical protein